MMMRCAALLLLLMGCAGARAEMIQAPKLLQYAPNMLGTVVEQQQLPFQGALPAGSGGAIVAFAQLLGLIAVWKSVSMAWTISSTSASPYMQQQHSWGGAFLMFFAGVLVFHLQKTMAMLAATIPGFPDLTPVLSY